MTTPIIYNMFCKCGENRELYPLTDWRIIRYRYTPYKYSRVYCQKCKSIWITRAKYVNLIKQPETVKNLFE